MILRTRSALERAQYEANVAFAKRYEPRSERHADDALPRVLVTGFGRFQTNHDNATGRIVECLTEAPYPNVTHEPADGTRVCDPARETSVRTRALAIDGRPLSICGMILPVAWDLAPLLLAREIVHYRPSVVIMNGVATGKTHIPLRIELGSANTALAGRPDGSGLLTAEPLSEGASETTLFQSAPSVLPSYFPWRAARAAAHLAIAREQHAGTLSRAMAGVEFGRFPSEWLTYLCNNLVYVTNAWLDDPRDFRLLESSSSADEGIALPPRPHGHPILRTFIHWPDLPKSDHAAGARVLLAIAYATLRSRGDDEGPTLGDPANADS